MGKRRMRFITWCKKDLEDERKINYTFRNFEDGKDAHWTSEDTCNFSTMERIRNAWIESIELIKNEFNNPEGEWYAVLYED